MLELLYCALQQGTRNNYLHQAVETSDPTRVICTVIWSIPNEIVLEILGYLDMKQLCQVSQVCKLWYAICEEGGLWSSLYKRRWTNPTALFLRKYHEATQCNYVPGAEDNQLESHGSYGPCWKSMCVSKKRLEKRWREGKYSTQTLYGHTDFVRCLQYDDDRNMVVSGSYDSSVKTWDMTTGKCLNTLRGHGNWVICLQTVADRLVTGSSDKTLKMWDLEKNECMLTLQGHTHSVICLQWDMGTAQAAGQRYPSRTGTSAAGKMVTGSYDKTFRVWDLATGQCVQCIEGHSDKIRFLEYDNTKLVSCSDDKSIKVWDLRGMNLRCGGALEGHSDRVHVVHLNDNQVLSGGADNTIKEWDIRTLSCVNTLKGHTNCVRYLQYDQSKIVSASWDRSLRMWPRAYADQGPIGWEDSAWSVSHEDCVLYVQFDDEKMVSGAGDKTIKIWRFDGPGLSRQEISP
jgi:WD40 repeat protein